MSSTVTLPAAKVRELCETCNAKVRDRNARALANLDRLVADIHAAELKMNWWQRLWDEPELRMSWSDGERRWYRATSLPLADRLLAACELADLVTVSVEDLEAIT